ncbi:hypothetical protein AKJ16_DCAP21930 [Drosera capensis]
MDPRLATFLRICREKLGINSPGSRSRVGGGTRESYGSTTGRKPDCGANIRHSRLSSPRSSMQGKLTSDAMQDLDLGGADTSKRTAKLSSVPHIMLVDNLEKNITPSAIVNFIGRCTSTSTDAYVFPSLWFESYTTGALLANSAEKLQRLQTFLTKPDQIITSSRGRPWVVPDITKYDSCSASYGFPELNAQIKMPQIKSESGVEEHALKVVHAGSEEYTKAELLRLMFLEFSNHQHRLHRRLLFEEGRILGPSMC